MRNAELLYVDLWCTSTLSLKLQENQNKLDKVLKF